MDLITIRAAPPSYILKKRKRQRQLLSSLRKPSIGEAGPSSPPSSPEPSDSPRKKPRTSDGNVGLNKLSWKEIRRPLGVGFDSDGVLLSLEEVDDVEVIYGNGTQEGDGQGVSFRPSAKSRGGKGVVRSGKASAVELIADDPSLDEFDNALLPSWQSMNLRGRIKRALHTLGFTSPTEIQKLAIPAALTGRDVIGIAETGSGKTLAYGLPIINYVLSRPPHADSTTPRPLAALILAPTRELAMQVADHLTAVASKLSAPLKSTSQGPKPPPRVSVGAIVGGIDPHKQKRIIGRGMDIMVATPGRLWDMINEDDSVARSIRGIRFLVLDEADRMIETGHFAELEKITKLTFRVVEGDMTRDPEFDALPAMDEDVKPNEETQTLVFSATLSKELQKNLKKGPRRASSRGPQRSSTTLDDLLMKLDFRDPRPEVIDLSPEGGVVSTLQESRVQCLLKDKDLYLYYFLLRYPGRTLVFLGSIDGIRRLLPLLQLLNINAFPLHSQLEQKQRLKNLDRFRDSKNAVLVATDIAARGLDIPSVDHVVHYQIPRSTDVYVHRSGRTARAKQSGFSLLLIGPDEIKVEKLLLQNLGRPMDDVPDLVLEGDLLDKLRQRISLAKRIDEVSHRMTKANHEQNWMKKAAEEMDLDIDEDFGGRLSNKGDGNASKEKAQIASLKKDLARMLKQPILAGGVSVMYITSGTRSVVDDLLTGQSHAEMLGVRNTAAGKDAVRKRGT